MIDSTLSKVHWSAATVGKSEQQCIGKSAGGYTTKIHASVNEHGLPLDFKLTVGQAHDTKGCEGFFEQLQPNQCVIADRAYDANWIRQTIFEKGAHDCIPYKSNRICPHKIDKKLYKQRNLIERFFGRLKKSFRSIALRHEKYAKNFMAVIKLASIRLWCEFYQTKYLEISS